MDDLGLHPVENPTWGQGSGVRGQGSGVGLWIPGSASERFLVSDAIGRSGWSHVTHTLGGSGTQCLVREGALMREISCKCEEWRVARLGGEGPSVPGSAEASWLSRLVSTR